MMVVSSYLGGHVSLLCLESGRGRQGKPRAHAVDALVNPVNISPLLCIFGVCQILGGDDKLGHGLNAICLAFKVSGQVLNANITAEGACLEDGELERQEIELGELELDNVLKDNLRIIVGHARK